jgi:hypothetical protein
MEVKRKRAPQVRPEEQHELLIQRSCAALSELQSLADAWATLAAEWHIWPGSERPLVLLFSLVSEVSRQIAAPLLRVKEIDNAAMKGGA